MSFDWVSLFWANQPLVVRKPPSLHCFLFRTFLSPLAAVRSFVHNRWLRLNYYMYSQCVQYICIMYIYICMYIVTQYRYVYVYMYIQCMYVYILMCIIHVYVYVHMYLYVTQYRVVWFPSENSPRCSGQVVLLRFPPHTHTHTHTQ